MKNPGKHLLFTFILLGFFIFKNSYSQNYTLGFGPVFVASQDTSSLLNTKGVEIINSGTVAVSGITYKLLLKDTLNDCHFELCVSGNCMGKLDSSGTIPTLAPGETGWLKIHFFSGKTYGINKVKYFIKNGSLQSDTLTWIMKVEQITGIEESKKAAQNISVYPIPASDVLHFSGLNENNSVNIYNVLGTEVEKISRCNYNTTLSTENLPSGVYFYCVNTGNKCIKKGKFIVSQP